MIDCLNSGGLSVPVVHAQGDSLFELGGVLEYLQLKRASVPAWIGVVTCCNAPKVKDAILIRQLEKNQIPYENPAEQLSEWRNALKPGLIVQGIEMLPPECRYVLVLDALDVALNGDLERAMPEYHSYGKPILFGATRNNWPDVIIDRVSDRDWRGPFRYLNAGTSFGPIDEMLAFYRLVDDAAREFPECEREQPLVRLAFDRCQSWVEFDWRCLVFQTLSRAFVEDVDGAVKVN